MTGEDNTEMEQAEAGLRVMSLWLLKGQLMSVPGTQEGGCGLLG